MNKKQMPFKVFSKHNVSPLPHFQGSKEEVYAWLDNNAYGPDGFLVYHTETELHQDARDFLEENNPFASKFYRMNPETDELLPNGRHLANGMRVLLEDSNKRIRMDGENELRDWEADLALERNRWCTVGALENDGVNVRFIGVYEDGSKRMRTYTIDTPWLVKIDSLNGSLEQSTDRYQNLFDTVKVAFAEHESLVSRHDYPADGIYQLIESTTKKILGLL